MLCLCESRLRDAVQGALIIIVNPFTPWQAANRFCFLASSTTGTWHSPARFSWSLPDLLQLPDASTVFARKGTNKKH